MPSTPKRGPGGNSTPSRDAEAHIAEHRRLVEQVLDYKRKLEAGEVSLNMELMMFLKNWLIKHILGSDKLYVAHFVERRVQ